MADEQELNNWRRKSGLLSWGMEIPDNQDEGPALMTRRCTLDSVRLLDDFASVSQASWTTESFGEDALVQDFSDDDPSDDDPSALDQMAEVRLPDLFATDLMLNLLVEYPVEPAQRTLRNAGFLFCEYAQTYPSGRDRPGGPGISLNLVLDVDIYARQTYTVAKENRALADLNAPRLNRYLGALQENFGTPFTDIEYEGDQSQIDHNGFIGHDEPHT